MANRGFTKRPTGFTVSGLLWAHESASIYGETEITSQ